MFSDEGVRNKTFPVFGDGSRRSAMALSRHGPMRAGGCACANAKGVRDQVKHISGRDTSGAAANTPSVPAAGASPSRSGWRDAKRRRFRGNSTPLRSTGSDGAVRPLRAVDITIAWLPASGRLAVNSVPVVAAQIVTHEPEQMPLSPDRTSRLIGSEEAAATAECVGTDGRDGVDVQKETDTMEGIIIVGSNRRGRIYNHWRSTGPKWKFRSGVRKGESMERFDQDRHAHRSGVVSRRRLLATAAVLAAAARIGGN